MLLGKLARVALVTFAVLIVLGSVGIDFSALAIFSGAVGVGIGFGLQKIVSNLVSGIILLADKSIKPGDVITVGDSFGWVDTMGARYTSVVSRDGREYLIPNEDFITQRVVNWTFSNDRVRNDVKFGVSYGSDPHRVRAAAIAAAASVARVLKDAGADLPPHRLRRLLARLHAAVLDPRSERRARHRAQRGDVRAVGRVQARRHRVPVPAARLNVKEPVRVVVERGGDSPPAAA